MSRRKRSRLAACRWPGFRMSSWFHGRASHSAIIFGECHSITRTQDKQALGGLIEAVRVRIELAPRIGGRNSKRRDQKRPEPSSCNHSFTDDAGELQGIYCLRNYASCFINIPSPDKDSTRAGVVLAWGGFCSEEQRRARKACSRRRLGPDARQLCVSAQPPCAISSEAETNSLQAVRPVGVSAGCPDPAR